MQEADTAILAYLLRCAARRLAVLALVVPVWAAGAGAATVSCADAPVTIEIDHPHETPVICEAAGRAAGRLAACGITASRQTTIKVLSDPGSAAALGGYGSFHAGTGTMTILSFSGSAERLRVDRQRAGIDPADYYPSVIVHEVSHSLLHAAAAANPLSVVAQEYLGYALQLESMPARAREALLAPIRDRSRFQSSPPDEILLLMSVTTFAAASYLHFAAQKDRCVIVRKVLDKELTFERPSE